MAQQIKAINLLAFMRSRQGRGPEAIRLYQQAAAVAAQGNDRNNQALGFYRAGSLLRVSGLYAESLECLDRALGFYREVKNLAGQVRVLATLASVYTEVGDFDKARQQLQQAMPLVEALHDKVLVEVLLLRQGTLEKEIGNNELALKFGLQALALDEAHDFEATKRETRRVFVQTFDLPIALFALTRQELLLHLGNVYGALGNPQKSAEFLERGMQLAETRSAPLLTAVILGNVAGTQLKLFVSQHRDEEALAIAEAWHARAFLDILTESRIDLRKDLSASQREQEDKIFARISGIQKELWRPGLPPAREAELKTELATAESALESFQLEMRRTNPLYAHIKYPEPVKPAIIAGDLVDAHTALVEYVLSDRHSFAWVVYRGRISSFVLPPKKEIEETFAISYAPSASALFAIKQNRSAAAGKGLLAFGDSVYPQAVTQRINLAVGLPAATLRELPYARTEVNDVGSLFLAPERRLFLGPEAREQTLKAEPLDRYRYIHLAAHGVIDEEYPARSGILLSDGGDSQEDGVLQMSEVMRLKMRADLVTLSACRSGLGQLVKGEGIIGLTRSFLYAGADSVVVSLWDVNDLSTAALMKSFYANLKNGLPKDEALRQAKLQLLHGQKRAWQQPYFWAPFVLVGDNN